MTTTCPEITREDMKYANTLTSTILFKSNIDPDSPLCDECRSAANLALIRASQNYNVDRGANWRTYIHMRVTSAVKTLLNKETADSFLGMRRVGRRKTPVIRVFYESLSQSEQTVNAEQEIVDQYALEQIYETAEKTLKTNVYLMFYFHFKDGYTISELSRMFNLSHSVIIYHINNAVSKLKRIFNDEIEPEIK